jgi:hypothetical protein
MDNTLNKLYNEAFNYLLKKGFKEYPDYGGLFCYNKNFKDGITRLAYRKDRITINTKEDLEKFKVKVNFDISKDYYEFKTGISTILLSQKILFEIIKKLEDKRDEHSITSSEYIEIDQQIDEIESAISFAKIR